MCSHYHLMPQLFNSFLRHKSLILLGIFALFFWEIVRKIIYYDVEWQETCFI
jgi:hypothetical protein